MSVFSSNHLYSSYFSVMNQRNTNYSVTKTFIRFASNLNLLFSRLKIYHNLLAQKYTYSNVNNQLQKVVWIRFCSTTYRYRDQWHHHSPVVSADWSVRLRPEGQIRTFAQVMCDVMSSLHLLMDSFLILVLDFCFLICTLLKLFSCIVFSCFSCYFGFWSRDSFSFMLLSFSFNKGSPFVLPQPCLLSWE